MNTKTKTGTKPAPAKPKAGVQKADASPATKPKAGKVVASFDIPKDPEYSEALARFAISPKAQAAVTVHDYSKVFGKLELESVAECLGKSIRAVQAGELKECEAMLIGQAHSLQAIFRSLAAQAQANIGHYPKAVDSYLRLALKAQSQCRATLETLATIKNPPTVFARQANITTGPQQVNNGTPTPAGNFETNPNELLEEGHAERMDG